MEEVNSSALNNKSKDHFYVKNEFNFHQRLIKLGQQHINSAQFMPSHQFNTTQTLTASSFPNKFSPRQKKTSS